MSDEELLKKCLHEKTQKNNESLNGVIWKKCPKDVFIGRATLEIGVASAVLNFNDGSSGVLNVLNSLKIEPEKFTTEFCGKRDSECVTKMDLKSSDQTKLRRNSKFELNEKGLLILLSRKRAWYMVQGILSAVFQCLIFNISVFVY